MSERQLCTGRSESQLSQEKLDNPVSMACADCRTLAYKERVMKIGLKLRALREEQRISQGVLEDRTGLLCCYISRVENGHIVPAIETLEKMANALDVPMWQLFHDGNTKATPLRLRKKKRNKMFSEDQALESEMRKHIVKMNPRDRKLFLYLAMKMARVASVQ